MIWELHEVRMVGFKSFSRRTKVGLGKGLTAIVGSNGCGKTNIADAVRFALGEMRPHQLRVENLEDVIFAGTANATPVVVAEVTLTFVDRESDGVFTITRRLTRGGDTEYRIDGQPARLKDLQRKLEQIGIVSQRGVVVELRHMDEVLIDGSKLPRLMVEEGCGIAPFLERRNHAQSKLDDALRSLELLEPRIQQINLDLERLAQQAQRAKRWRNTRDALDRARNSEQWGEVRRLRTEIDSLTTNLEQLRADNSSESELVQVQADIAQTEEAYQSIQNNWETITDELFALGTTRESAALKIKEFELRRVKNETLIETSKEDLKRIDAELLEISEEKPNTLIEEIDRASKELNRISTDLLEREESYRLLSKEHENNQKLKNEFEQNRFRVQSTIQTLIDSRNRLSNQINDLSPLPVQDPAIGTELEHLITEKLQEEKEFQLLADRQKTAVALLDEQHQLLMTDLANVRGDKGRQEREILWIERMLADRPDLSQELREFIKKHAREIQLIRDEGNDNAMLLYQIASTDRIMLPENQVSAILTDALKHKFRCEWAINTETKLVELSRLLQENPPPGVEWIASEGVTRDASGILRTIGDEESSVPVGLPKQLSLLKEKLASLLQNEQRNVDELATVSEKLKVARDDYRLAIDQIAKSTIKRSELEHQLVQFRAQVAETNNRNLLRRAEQERLTKEINDISSQIENLKSEEAILVAPDFPDLVPTLTDAATLIENLRDEKNKTEYTLHRLQIELRNYEIILDQRKQKQKLLIQRQLDNRKKISELSSETETIQLQWQNTRTELTVLERKEAELQEQRNQIGPSRNQISEKLQSTRVNLEIIRNRVEEWHTQIALHSEKLVQLQSQLTDRTRSANETGPEPKETVRVGAEEITRLEQRLKSLEPVNHLAEQEYDTLKSEVEFLHTERNQIREAAEIHRKSVDEAIRFAVEKLTVARVQIEQNFTDIIARLFPGGEAALEWGEGDILTDAPLLLKVSPRGKRIRSLRILSGGERALVALAFLVAVLGQNRALPFLILDEVDAPLDEENTVRFLHWVKDLTATTQVVLLTHNRQSIAASDTWVGVTMPEPGISQTVKVIPALEET